MKISVRITKRCKIKIKYFDEIEKCMTRLLTYKDLYCIINIVENADVAQ